MQITSRATLAQDCREIAGLIAECLAFVTLITTVVFVVAVI